MPLSARCKLITSKATLTHTHTGREGEREIRLQTDIRTLKCQQATDARRTRLPRYPSRHLSLLSAKLLITCEPGPLSAIPRVCVRVYLWLCVSECLSRAPTNSCLPDTLALVATLVGLLGQLGKFCIKLQPLPFAFLSLWLDFWCHN